jgi:hypothetical protein
MIWQGGIEHVPAMHVGLLSGQALPHAPQLKGSSCLSTQAPEQQT